MKKEKSKFDKLVETLSGIFIPMASVLSAAGILKGIIIILVTAGALSDSGETYMVLNAMADSVFYFLPVVLAYTGATKLGANPVLAIVVAGILLYPQLNTVLESGKTIRFCGLPIKGVIYHSTVLPILMATILLVYVEKLCKKIYPELVTGILTPVTCVCVVSGLTLLVLGPIGGYIGDVLALGYEKVYAFSPAIAGFILGGTIQVMVVFGLQWGIVLVAMNNVALTNHDTILALIGPAVFAQAGAALAVMFKTKDKGYKTVCATAFVSGIFGVTEPALYGVTFPKKKPFLVALLGGAVGGAIVGISGCVANSFAFPSVPSLPVYFGTGFALYCIANVVGLIIGFVGTMLVKFDAAPIEEN